jgi:hypothetical protein
VKTAMRPHLETSNSLSSAHSPPCAGLGASMDVRASRLFGAIAVSCRRILRNQRASPQVRSMARSIQNRVLIPYQKCFAAVSANPALAVYPPYSVAFSMWVDLAPILHIIARRVEDALSVKDAMLSEVSACPASVVLSSLEESILNILPSSHAHQAVQSVWADVFAVFAVHINLWVDSGEIFDEFGEFFIVSSKSDSNPLSSPGIPYPRYVSRRLPSFMSPENAEQIILCGHIISSINGVSPAGTNCSCVRRPSTSLRVPHFVTADMVENGRRIALAIDAASSRCKESTCHELSRVIPSCDVNRTLRALRGYLLFGYERFWRSFFTQLRRFQDLLRPSMTAPEVETAERCLKNILNSCFSDDRVEMVDLFRFQLHVRMDGTITPSYIIPHPVAYMFPPTSAKFSDIFRVAFEVREAVYELERCYMLIATAYRSVKNRKNGVKLSTLKKCSLLRMLMSRFLQAYDEYLQMDVFESAFLGLIDAASKMERENGQERRDVFDEVLALYNKALDTWFIHSLASSDAVTRRLDAICKGCVQFCHHVDDFLAGSTFDDVLAHRIETDFEKNASLFLRVVSSVHSRVGGAQISMLLMRMDFNNYLHSRQYSRDRDDDHLIFSRSPGK